jgi:carbonic anhydrase
MVFALVLNFLAKIAGGFPAANGELFVCRNAGNVADTDVLGSIEYGIEHLGSSLVVVMGHSRCGAVQV